MVLCPKQTEHHGKHLLLLVSGFIEFTQRPLDQYLVIHTTLLANSYKFVSAIPKMSSFTSIISSPTSISLSITSTSDCITATPGKNGYVPPEACNAEWSYSPSFAAAVLFTVLFGLTTLTQLCQAIYYKKLRLCWPLLMGATWETGGFAFRVVGSKNQQTSIFSFMAQFLVLLAPMWVNAFVYMVLGRMIYFFVPQKEVWGIKSIKIAKIFVWLDILSFLVQATGVYLYEVNSDIH